MLSLTNVHMAAETHDAELVEKKNIDVKILNIAFNNKAALRILQQQLNKLK